MKKLFVVLAMMLLLVGCSETEAGAEPEAVEPEPEIEVLVDGEFIKASFVKLYDEPTISGACYLQLLVENKSDQPITVHLDDAYVNDVSVMIGSGVPMDIEPGKKSQTPFIVFNHETADIDTLDFKICVWDESLNTIEETEMLRITNE